eukprot:CAMPEP_0117650174 /NCGR_PEP_ID=MMETSP0804-20121206/1395_1 /TAXON_ID=1074897 /ORGANISM="Tetraselmis astigmatica, Strain CCMP880" /LENGTH=183 /DNA_ID=CAMNT_0005456021 /DNA_START=670 /DNA_END=1221 /DNA_ORIENTATION=-
MRSAVPLLVKEGATVAEAAAITSARQKSEGAFPNSVPRTPTSQRREELFKSVQEMRDSIGDLNAGFTLRAGSATLITFREHEQCVVNPEPWCWRQPQLDFSTPKTDWPKQGDFAVTMERMTAVAPELVPVTTKLRRLINEIHMVDRGYLTQRQILQSGLKQLQQEFDESVQQMNLGTRAPLYA